MWRLPKRRLSPFQLLHPERLMSASILSTPSSHADRQSTEVAEGSSGIEPQEHKPSRPCPKPSHIYPGCILARLLPSHSRMHSSRPETSWEDQTSLNASVRPTTPHRPDTSRAKWAIEAWVSTAPRYISSHIVYDLLSAFTPVVTPRQQPTFYYEAV